MSADPEAGDEGGDRRTDCSLPAVEQQPEAHRTQGEVGNIGGKPDQQGERDCAREECADCRHVQ